MDIRDRQALKTAAREALDGAAYNPTKLIVIHTAIALGASLLVTALNFILETRIADTGGLGYNLSVDASAGGKAVLVAVLCRVSFKTLAYKCRRKSCTRGIALEFGYYIRCRFCHFGDRQPTFDFVWLYRIASPARAFSKLTYLTFSGEEQTSALSAKGRGDVENTMIAI